MQKLKTLKLKTPIAQIVVMGKEKLANFDRAIELKPDYAWAIARRGETYFLMQRYPEAVANFDRAIELKPDYAWAIAHRGATYRLMGKQYYDLALADLNRAIELNPDYAWALIHRANIYTIRKRYEEALADVDRALALNDKIIPHWPGERGLVLSYMGRYAEVISCCEGKLAVGALVLAVYIHKPAKSGRGLKGHRPAYRYLVPDFPIVHKQKRYKRYNLCQKKTIFQKRS